jgi:hypothetical protein
MQWTERRDRFRAILGGASCIHPASVFDPVPARIAEDLGFELGMFAGSVASLVVLGAPDLTLITVTEFAEQAHRICRAGKLPLLVDADHGYGNALNVMRTVEELETAGVAALTIEDTALPQAFGAGGAIKLLSIEEGVGKMKAALAGRRDPRLAYGAFAIGMSAFCIFIKEEAKGERKIRKIVFSIPGQESRIEESTGLSSHRHRVHNEFWRSHATFNCLSPGTGSGGSRTQSSGIHGGRSFWKFAYAYVRHIR